MLDQYRRIKKEHPGEVLFFRLGDFYEMFADDALEISSLLNLTLTSRGGQPMCGIPYHAARSYIARLLKHGKKIAVCEQITEPGKGLIERKVVEVITPGTTVDEDYLDKESSNYLACLARSGLHSPKEVLLSFAYIDLSVGSFFATSFPQEGGVERLGQELERLQINEMIIQESILAEDAALARAINERTSLVVNRWADWLFDRARSCERLEKQFGPSSLKGFGLHDKSPEMISAGALLDYLDDTAKTLIPHVRSISIYTGEEFAGMDEATQRNLELTKNLQDGDSRFTLLDVMDETRTSMGRRLLKWRILHPLRDTEKIRRRLDMVETLYQNQERLSRIREFLGKTPDLERLGSRIAMDKAHGKDMAAVRKALECFALVVKESEEFDFHLESPEAASLVGEKNPEGLKALGGLRDLLEKGIAEDPAVLLAEGNLIRDGFDQELDRQKSLKNSGRKLLEEYLEEEKAATGINNLKIRYNRIIGYYFEVTKVHLSKTPPHFIRRQGIAAGERFTTDRLAALESEINGAQDRIFEIEKRLFLEIREKAKKLLLQLGAAALVLAELDTSQSLARAATRHAWIRPIVDGQNRLHIIEGRHPVVEANLPPGEFIPNDIILDADPSIPGISFALITGPNMAGKSTYLRQAALLLVMAQCGSFVPAGEARIGICDSIYCRVGAQDNLARGESTFLVEMNETAYILHTATERSLVIMDEIGRGTGTNDGLAIAWAVSEDLLNRVKCRTLFATHYHELAQLRHPRLANRSMEVDESGGKIVFLRKLKEGATESSYGLHVAQLAGLPETVLERAAEFMEDLSAKNRVRERVVLKTSVQDKKKATPFKAAPGAAKLLNELSKVDPNLISPMEALALINKWKALTLKAGTGEKAQPALKPKNPRLGEDGPSLFDL
ncbi:MAG: DNA mismatch repair protein MutS [Treponema sp.]|jgi:DNA mismatch repair protein MutS|nr:DNA mismatch repair protein MutS [Treponema sp.]